MAERHRSTDNSRDTDAVSRQGRAGGTLQRDIATQDDLKRATERPAGRTDEKEKGDA